MQLCLENFNKSKQQEITSFIKRKTKAIGFDITSDSQTGALLRVLAASKPRGVFLELGTGTGFGASWIRQGMDDNSHLISVDCDETVLDIAKEAFMGDRRIQLVHQNAYVFIKQQIKNSYDLIFADAFPGKYDLIQETLNLLKPGGFYILDDMLPKSSWPSQHQSQIESIIKNLSSLIDMSSVGLHCSSGLIVLVPK